jgi:hypothetical protein
MHMPKLNLPDFAALPRYFRTTLAPEAYHGSVLRPPFFEGWYFKAVTRAQERAFVFIPGVYHAVDPARSHSFVQVMDGRSGTAEYISYPLEEFAAAEGELDVRVGPNHFTRAGISLDIPGLASGALRHQDITPWPVTLTHPGIMGPFAWVPRMECYHGVVSLDHGLLGRLELGGQPVDFDGGRGYIEKDWGRSFPQAWVWFQSNHFRTPGVCITASVAIIPWMGSSFNGFIAGLLHDGRLLTFATYNRSRIEHLEITDRVVVWVLRGGGYRLEIAAERAEGGILRAPTTIEMDRRIAETLNSRVEVRLLELRGGRSRLVFHDTGASAGLEAVGDMQRLVHP